MVKCADCGYLTLFNRTNGTPMELDNKFREHGQTSVREIRNSTSDYPLCFINSFDLYKEGKELFGEPLIVPGQGDITNWPERILGIIQKERDCGEFIKWQQGFTPKEHWEINERKRIKEYLENQRKEDRIWQRNQQKQLAYIAGIFTILGAVIGALVSLFR